MGLKPVGIYLPGRMIKPEKDNKHKKIFYHALPIVILLILTIVYFNDFLNFNELPRHDYEGYYWGRAELLKISFFDYHKWIQLWNPFVMSGQPLLAILATQGQFYLLAPLILLFGNSAVALKLNYVLIFLIAALSMYFFVFYLIKNRLASLVSAFVFVLNGWTNSRFSYGHLTTLNAYALIPLIFLFTMKALKSKDNWFLNSVILGLLFGLQIHGGPDLKVFLFTALIFGFFLIFNLIGKNFKKKFMKILIIGAIVVTITFGITAIKTLVSKDYLDLTGRLELPYEQASKKNIKPNMIFSTLIEPFYKGWPQFRRESTQLDLNIGLISFLLILYAIYKRYKNKNVLFFSFVLLLDILIVTNTFVFYLLWKYVPLFSGFRYLERALSLFAFSGAVLAGYGALEFFLWIKQKKISTNLKNKVIPSILLVLIFINLFLLMKNPFVFGKVDYKKTLEDQKILNYIEEQKGIFRIHFYETRGIDWGVESFTIPRKISNIYAYEGSWLVEYMNVFLSYALSQPAKFWGILNVKYVTSQENLSIDGLTLIRKFDNCTFSCPDNPAIKAWGPYLYENERLIPKVYFTKNNILVLGLKEKSNIDYPKQIMYSIMQSSYFEPRNTVVVLGNKGNLANYNPAFLKKFDIIVLTPGNLDQNSEYILKQFKDGGGVLMPDIIEGKNTISQEDIEEALKSLDSAGSYEIYDSMISFPSLDETLIELNGNEEGFLVISDQFTLYPGWKAEIDDKEADILRANGVVSSIYVPKGSRNVYFYYKPRPYIIGRNITLLTAVLLLVYFGVILTKRFRK